QEEDGILVFHVTGVQTCALPILCVITIIWMDHSDLLGNTLAEIASEKAGIIKKNVPVVLSERDETIAHIFERKALEMGAPLRFASTELAVSTCERQGEGLVLGVCRQVDGQEIELYVGLAGGYQQKNVLGV